MIKLTNLTKTFRGFKAVQNLSFEVPENRIFGFLGPNGAGKTTTIRMIVGLIKPTSGEIEIGGEKVSFGDMKTNKLFGYLPEQPSFYTWMTGIQYLNFAAETFGIVGDKKDKKIEDLLKLVNLLDAKNRKIGAYSNGMKQRLGIAQALIGNPKVLIMDEPVSALDPIGRKEVLEVIENLRDKTTVFMSTHILSDVDRICDDVAIINMGKLVVQSSISELKEKYAKPILEVEFQKNPNGVFEKLKDEKWVEKIEKDGNLIRIWLRDEDIIAKNTALKFLSCSEIGILRYGLNLPQIEDLFVEAVSSKQ